ncbi:MAG: ATP-binding protein [Gammaproteobacteria bacterium]|nr:ATP-binding protein [Gammaproteobacteria bacterium]
MDQLWQRQLTVIIAHVLAAALFLLVSWDVVSRTELVTFFILILSFSAGLRLLFYVLYSRAPSPAYHASQWATRFTLISFISGLIWGSTPFVFLMPEAPLHMIYLLLILVGLSASALSASAPYFPAYLAFVIPVMGLLTLKLLFFSTDDLILLGVLAIIFLVSNIYYGRAQSYYNQQWLLLGYENLELVDTLKLEKDRAEKASRAKSRFLAAASHDLRQPLHAMGLYLHVLSESVNKESAGLVEKITQSMQALEGLLNALLDISRLDAGIVEVHRKTLSLNHLMSKLVEELGPEAKERGIGLKAAYTKLNIYSDPVLLERILRNFIVNAMNHAPEGDILVGARRRQGEVVIQVWDNGPGIPTEELANIFEEFYQVENPERDRTKGLGLGLAIVNRTAELLGHRVMVQSRHGRGSVFEIYVPFSDEVVEKSKPRVTGGQIPGFARGQKYILLIDDDPAIREASVALLEKWGGEVMAVETPEEAQQITETSETPFSLIISDYRLRQGGKGNEVVDALRQGLDYEPGVIILTGDTSAEVLNEVRASGYMVLHKPLNPAQLRMAINRLLK